MSRYAKYYTSADCSVYFERDLSEYNDSQLIEGLAPIVKLDKLAGIGWGEQLTSSPVYGIGSSFHGFVTKGNLSVTGVLSINFTDDVYLTKIIDEVTQSGGTLYESDDAIFEKWKQLEHREAENVGTELYLKRTLDSKTGIERMLSGFNIRVVFDNGNLYHGDESKTYVLRDIKILSHENGATSGTDGAITQTYRFIARSCE